MTAPSEVTFTCPFAVMGWQRAGKNGKRHFTRPESKNFRDAVQWEAWRSFSEPPWRGACEVDVFVLQAMPASWSAAKQAAHMGRLHRSKPDKDNVLKAICDALNGLIWVDDAQAAIQRIEMRWGERSQFRVTVREIEP